MNPLTIDDEKKEAGLMARGALYFNPIPLDGEGGDFFVCGPYHGLNPITINFLLLSGK